MSDGMPLWRSARSSEKSENGIRSECKVGRTVFGLARRPRFSSRKRLGPSVASPAKPFYTGSIPVGTLVRGERTLAARLDEVMPRVSSFYGIVITMYFGDHAPPHFHARHGGDE